MRILDVDFQEAISQMNNKELEKIMKQVMIVQSRSEAAMRRSIDRIASSSDLKQAIEDICGKDKSEIISDDKAINDEVNKANSQLHKQLSRSEFERQTSIHNLENLIRRTEEINYDKEFAKKFEGMSSNEINDAIQGLRGNTLQNSDIRMKIRILETMKAKAYAKECVSKIPDKKILEAKEEFESLIEKAGVIKDDVTKVTVLKNMMQNVLGQEFDSSKSTTSIQVVDFAMAFEDRVKEKEDKKKNNIFAKIKNFFMRHAKTKALPEGKGENIQQSGRRENYVSTLKVEQENIKDSDATNEKTMTKGQNLKALEDNDKCR